MAAAAAPRALLALVVVAGSRAAGLLLEVAVHYPERGSALEHCGFRLHVAAQLGEEQSIAAARRRGRDTFVASLEVPDAHLFTQASVGVLAEFDQGDIWTPACWKFCPRLGPQGWLLQAGPFARTQPLEPSNRVELWPALCAMGHSWATVNASFVSRAIGRRVHVRARIPESQLENPLPRPGGLLSPVLFRFNPEWFWAYPGEEYAAWHRLMLDGAMEPVAVAEVWVEGMTFQSWVTQPILTLQPLRTSCGACAPELQFICNSWESSSVTIFEGGNHSYGSAGLFFDELHDRAVPQLLRSLPKASDGQLPRLGVWGYCIGGLAAFNALVARPGRFSFAYLGSPAVDFNCGSSFQALEGVTWGKDLPKVYIDAGAAEGDLMNEQTLLLLRKLQDTGLVLGRDVFYEQALFGTHQSRGLLRRALKGLTTLFGSGKLGCEARVAPASAAEGSAPLAWSLAEISRGSPQELLVVAAAAFAAGRLTTGLAWRRPGHGQQPLLA